MEKILRLIRETAVNDWRSPEDPTELWLLPVE